MKQQLSDAIVPWCCSLVIQPCALISTGDRIRCRTCREVAFAAHSYSMCSFSSFVSSSTLSASFNFYRQPKMWNLGAKIFDRSEPAAEPEADSPASSGHDAEEKRVRSVRASMSSGETLSYETQDGVHKAEAAAYVWTLQSLIFAYVLYVCAQRQRSF